MKYTEFKKEIQAKIDAFPFMFAFSNQQLEEGKQKLGIKDNSELISIGAGGYIRKTDKQAYLDLMNQYDKALTDFLKDPEQLKDAFRYELDNHEFCITWETEPALDALGIEDPRDLNEEQQKALVEALEGYKERLRELEEEAEEREDREEKAKRKIFTMADWKKDFLQDVEPFRDAETMTAEITEDVYYNFMESLPPIQIWKGFMNSEPHDHNEKGQAMFLSFQNIGDKYYYIGTLTREQAKLLS